MVVARVAGHAMLEYSAKDSPCFFSGYHTKYVVSPWSCRERGVEMMRLYYVCRERELFGPRESSLTVLADLFACLVFLRVSSDRLLMTVCSSATCCSSRQKKRCVLFR